MRHGSICGSGFWLVDVTVACPKVPISMEAAEAACCEPK